MTIKQKETTSVASYFCGKFAVGEGDRAPPRKIFQKTFSEKFSENLQVGKFSKKFSATYKYTYKYYL